MSFPNFKFIAVAILLSVGAGYAFFSFGQPKAEPQISRYHVNISPQVAQGLGLENPSVGSSLKLASYSGDSYNFYAITDRGPVANFSKKGQYFAVFPYPDFTPSILKLTLNTAQETATVDGYIPLTIGGKPINGIPDTRNLKDPNQLFEVPLNDNFEPITESQTMGLDCEGLAIGQGGSFWVSDEYLPSLNAVDPNGAILKTYRPGAGLPEIIKWRMLNRGFEGVAVAPNGKVYLTLESVLDIDQATKNTAQFIRIIEFTPETGATRMFAYPYDQDTYLRPYDVKIGDIDSLLNDDEFLLIEQGPTVGGFRNVIYKINIKNAIDISSFTLADGRDLEYGDLEAVKKYFLPKTEIFEARDYGWEHDKMEGIAVVDDRTFALINDNDFGYEGYETDIGPDNKKKLRLKPKPKDKQSTELWLVQYPKSL